MIYGIRFMPRLAVIGNPEKKEEPEYNVKGLIQMDSSMRSGLYSITC
jgi:hypothetical protein